MTEPDDRELQDYLKGDSRLSRAYRKVSAETTPPSLDEAILAKARAELKRKPDWNRALAPYALAASLLLGVNLAWNVYQQEPLPPATPALERAQSEQGAGAPPGEGRRSPASPAASGNDEVEISEPAPMADAAAPASQRAQERAKASAEARQEPGPVGSAQKRKSMAAPMSAGPAAVPAAAESGLAARDARADTDVSPSDEQQINQLLTFVGSLKDAALLGDGGELQPADAERLLRERRADAGADVRTADDFIELCASRSPTSGDPYRIRYADGRIEPLATALRRRLAELD